MPSLPTRRPTRNVLGLGLAATVVAAALSAWAWSRTPAHHVAIHWGLDGKPDGYADRWAALGLGPLLLLGATLLLSYLPAIDPRGSDVVGSRRAYPAIALVTI